ncbi:SDR family oxidoreductase [Flavicella sp.]|uniref:SDR family oxidoreductase n=1 Tax=Flavicella sp. TaxID=2957742 RepID=UPI00301AA67C
MSKNQLNVILTGGTGTLGSQIIFELLKQENIKTIFLSVRQKKGKSATSRIKTILESAAAPEFISKNKGTILNKIKVLDMDAFFKPENFLSKTESNFFIHSAGSVNLSTDISQKEIIYNGVFEFTKNVFDTFSSFITKFTYISTAFSIGNIGGLIGNDYHSEKIPKYRNFYEEYKHLTERFLLKKGKEKNIDIQILRPSVLGGNIFKKSTYFVSNYMVYYLLGKFFYKNPLNDNSIRIAANFKTGLNIIPVDYVAKVITSVFDKKIEQLNIVHSKSTNIVTGMSKIIKTVDFNNFTFLNSSSGGLLLEGKNRLESIYYNTIGLHLNQYLISDPYEYDTTLLESIVPIPKYNIEDYLEDTIRYAKARKFRGEKW